MLKRFKIFRNKLFLMGVSCVLMTACGGGGGGGGDQSQTGIPSPEDTQVQHEPAITIDPIDLESQKVVSKTMDELKDLSFFELSKYFPKGHLAITHKNIDQVIENYLSDTGKTLGDKEKKYLKNKTLGSKTGTWKTIDIVSLFNPLKDQLPNKNFLQILIYPNLKAHPKIF